MGLMGVLMGKKPREGGPFKSGHLAGPEKTFIEQYLETKTDEWLSKELNRSTHQISKYRKEYLAKQALSIKDDNDGQTYKYQLQGRAYWPELQKQFTADELLLFSDYFTRFVEQFSGDLLYTEESQLCDCIKIELLINRNLKDQAETIKQQERLQKQIEHELALPVINPERIAALEEQLLGARTASAARTTEHVKLQQEKNRLLESLKAKREQRIRAVIDEKINIFTLFRQFADIKNRQKEARQAGLFKLATEKENLRLSQPFKYENNETDIPILSCDTLEQIEQTDGTESETTS
jgi:hypothetical protein